MSYGAPNQQNPFSSPGFQKPGFQKPGFQQPGGFHPNSSEKKVNWPGFVSIGVGLVAGIGLVIAIGIATFLVVQAGPEEVNEESAEMIILGLGIIAGLGVAFLGLTIGVVGLFLPNSNRITATIGAAINLLTIVAVCGLMAIGMAAE